MTAFEKITAADSKFQRKRFSVKKTQKNDLNCNNRYEILKITNSNVENESQKSDNTTATNDSMESNVESRCTNRKRQWKN